MLEVFAKIFGSKHEKDIKPLLPVVEEINGYCEELQSLSDEELKAKTTEFRGKIRERTQQLESEIAALKEKLQEDLPREERQRIYDELEELENTLHNSIAEVLDELLPEAFAVVKEACRRHVGKQWEAAGTKITWDMVPFDVQLIGAVVLHQGKITEMATGEGKTLVATMPMYLNALTGRGVHLVTVNDYLALRDSQWMGKIFEFLGLKIGVILQHMDPMQRRREYECDITYGTNNEFGFDYLRDNMVIDAREMVQVKGHNYAIVDEVDSVLVDEARTPLIISGPVGVTEHKFDEMKPRVERLVNVQKNLVAKIVAEAEQLLEREERKEAGVLILRAYRGMPKNNRLAKLLAEGEYKKLMQDSEMEYLRDQARRMHEIDDELYFAIDEKNHTIDLTEKGRDFMAAAGDDKDFFVLPDMGTEVHLIEGDETLTAAEKQRKKEDLNLLYAERSDRLHTVQQLLRAYSLYERDEEYIVTEDGKVMIVDEFTGRLLPGRRYSEGLHQAIEAKESVKVERDTQTLATITLQNYFRLYKKLAGMTGTAETEAAEFWDIYKLDVVVIPTNKSVKREDYEDVVYRTKREKYNAVIEEIEQMRKDKRSTLVGTTSVEVSETISRMLKRKGIPHNVLNAKQHQREAEIVSHAGLPGMVTIATNMAGRGTDIKLGPGVVQAPSGDRCALADARNDERPECPHLEEYKCREEVPCGLHIVGTERHEARRIDRQLRGRSGRQGDPGSSRFFLALEDDLMRLFGSDRIAGIMQRMGVKEGEVIQHRMITRSVERAQKKVEENNYAIRKRLLEYDNVMNQQREVIYDRRRHALLGDGLRDDIFGMLDESVDKIVDKYYPGSDIEGLKDEVRRNFLADVSFSPEEFQRLGSDGVKAATVKSALEFYKAKGQRIGSELMRHLEQRVVLQVIDEKWKEHLREMDDLKEGIHLRAYGQKDPLVEYKTEGFNMFVEMLDQINQEVLGLVFKLFPAVPEEIPSRRAARPMRPSELTTMHQESLGMGFESNRGPVSGEETRAAEAARRPPQAKQQPVRVGAKVGRNEPCPCGSGKKYKHCHGR